MAGALIAVALLVALVWVILLLSGLDASRSVTTPIPTITSGITATSELSADNPLACFAANDAASGDYQDAATTYGYAASVALREHKASYLPLIGLQMDANYAAIDDHSAGIAFAADVATYRSDVVQYASVFAGCAP